jgi:hypothetical protein
LDGGKKRASSFVSLSSLQNSALLFKNEFSRSYGSTTENLSNSSNHAERAWPEMGVVS